MYIQPSFTPLPYRTSQTAKARRTKSYSTHVLTCDSLKVSITRKPSTILRKNSHPSTSPTKLQKALEAHGCKPRLTKSSIAPHTLGTLTANITYCKRRRTKSKFSRSAFSTLIKVSGTFGVDLALQQQREVVCKLFELLCFVFLEAAPIPYMYRRPF